MPTPYQWMLVEDSLKLAIERARARNPPIPARGVLDARNLPIATELTTRDRDPAKLGWKQERGFPAGAWSKRKKKAVALTIVLAVVTAIGMVSAILAIRGATKPAPPPTPRLTAVPRPPPPPPVSTPVPAPLSPEQQVEVAATFPEAIEISRAQMRDASDPLDGGGRLLAGYAARKLTWSDVDVPAETTIGLALKDPSIVRGKRLCASGTIERIERRDLEARKIYVGRLVTAEFDALEFVAVGSTGELVKRSKARLCGAVLGRAGDAVSLLGMFDLPENRNPIVEQ